jgi:predicted RNase H-like nuclease (RuvC/YqgF family)
MSTGSSAANKEAAAAPSELARLSKAVYRLLDEWEEWRQRAETAEARAKELERALRDITSGSVDPIALASRIQALEHENRFLARRLDRARESVKRISARLQFLDEDR